MAKKNKNPFQKSLFRRFIRFSIKWASIGFATIASTIVFSLTAVNFMLSDAEIEHQIKNSIELQTGGKVEISGTYFDVTNGITLENVSFFAPRTSNPYFNGGKVHSKPIAVIDSIKIDYDLVSLLTGSLIVRKITTSKPMIYLEDADGIQNFKGILDFRYHYLSSSKPLPPPEEEKEPAKETELSSIILFDPGKIYMPFKFDFQKIGIEQLTFQNRKIRNGLIVEDQMVKGLSLLANIYWSGFKSRFTVELKGGKTNELQVIMEKQRKSTKTLQEVFYLDANLKAKIQLVDLKRVSVEVQGLAHEINQGKLNLKSIPLEFKTDVSLLDSLDGIKLEHLLLNLVRKSIHIEMNGSTKVVDLKNMRINTVLNTKGNISLDKLDEFVQVFKLPYKFSGNISINQLDLEGDLGIGEIQKGNLAQIPMAMINLGFDKVFVKMDPLLLLERMDGYIKTNGLSASENITLDQSANISIAGLKVIPNENIGVDIKGLFFENLTRLEYPENNVPIIRLSVETEKISIQKGESNLQTNLYIKTSGSYRNSDKSLNNNLRVELDKLLSLSAMIDCNDLCREIRGDLNLKTENINSLEAILANELENLNEQFVPKDLNGRVLVTSSFKGSLKNVMEENIKAFINESKFDYRVNLGLEDFGISLPFKDIEVRNLNTDLALEGTPLSQFLSIDNRFSKIALSQLNKNGQLQNLRLGRSQLRMKIKNVLDQIESLKTIQNSSKTKFEVLLDLRDLNSTFGQKVELDSIKLDVLGSQNMARDVVLENLRASIPDLGFQSSLSASTTLSETFKPLKIDLSANTEISAAKNPRLLNGISTKGKMNFSIDAKSIDMDQFTIDGETFFENFGLVLPKPEKGFQTQVLNVNGRIPLNQNIKLSQFQKKSEEENEKITVEGQVSKFLERSGKNSLKNRSSLTLVDYQSVKQFFKKNRTLQISLVESSGLKIQDIEIDMELKQNVFAINQFLMKFLEGSIQGAFQVFFDPLPNKVKTSLHMTRLNTYRLLDSFPNLRDKTERGVFGENPYIDGTIHLDFDIKSNDIAGSIVMTSIGKEQLRMILYFVDPFEKDATINQIRMALNFGTVDGVTILIRNGELNIDIDLEFVNVIALPVPSIERIPITRMVNNMMQKKKKRKRGL